MLSNFYPHGLQRAASALYKKLVNNP
jgi:hypothetical protein